MKVKTSITLSQDVLAAVDQLIGERSRSEFIEAALRRAIAEERRRQHAARDLAIINRVADRLNEEADDVLLYVNAR